MVAARPNMREFMDATGADAATASELLYGVVGANRDTRDWGAIMSSSDPVSAAMQATGAMYAGPESTRGTRESGRYATIAPSSNTASIVRFAGPDGRDMFAIVAADGTPLRAGYGTEEQAREQGRMFGISGDVGTGTFTPALFPDRPPVASPASPVAGMSPASPVAATPAAMSPMASPLASPSQPMFASETLAPMAVPQFQQPAALPPLQPLLQAPQFQQPSQYMFQQYLPPQPVLDQGIGSLVGPTGLMG